MLSEFEIYSLEDIANEFGFKIDDPLLYAVYLKEILNYITRRKGL
jgi:hypothetical protein